MELSIADVRETERGVHSMSRIAMMLPMITMAAIRLPSFATGSCLTMIAREPARPAR